MEDWTRVVLYGTYDGFVRSTVDPLQIAVRLDGGERVEIPSECVISADQIVKKDEIKLRDVIKRIKDLDIGAREVWLNEILNELGSDYGSAKYKDGYEQGKLEGEWVGQQLKDADKIRQELNKPVVPQFVADFITEQKKHGLTLSYSIDASMSDRVAEWYWNNPELFARAWLDGYTVEEKQYLVKIKATKHFFARDGLRKIFFSLGYKSWFTREELEQAGFGWVFDCEGIEIVEVE